MRTQVAVGESGRVQPDHQQGGEQRVGAGSPKRRPATRLVPMVIGVVRTVTAWAPAVANRTQRSAAPAAARRLAYPRRGPSGPDRVAPTASRRPTPGAADRWGVAALAGRLPSGRCQIVCVRDQ